MPWHIRLYFENNNLLLAEHKACTGEYSTAASVQKWQRANIPQYSTSNTDHFRNGQYDKLLYKKGSIRIIGTHHQSLTRNTGKKIAVVHFTTDNTMWACANDTVYFWMFFVYVISTFFHAEEYQRFTQVTCCACCLNTRDSCRLRFLA